jgi:glutathione S-transferase
MKLSYTPSSPYTRKVLVIAHEIGITDKIELFTINPRTETDKLVPYNPLSKIPVLITDKGEAIYDSPVICEFIDTEYGGNCFLPRSGDRRWQILTGAALADGVLDAAILVRNERLRPAERQFAEWSDWQMKRVNTGLDRLEQTIGSFGNALDLRHVGTGCTLGYLEYRLGAERLLDKRPRLKTWYAALMQRPSFQKTMPSG